jgi:hypothetical protein
MRKIRVSLMILPLVIGALGAAPSEASPQGGDTNPLGTLRWLPNNANEKASVPAGQYRLTVVYDRSLDSTGKPVAMLGNGAFGLKVFTPSVADFRMASHSSHVDSLEQTTGQPQIAPVDQAFVGVSGDTRDGACSKVGTPVFSAAYSTTRTFVFPGTTPYAAINGPGACEVVDSSTPVAGGFNTTVTTFAPGFWINVTWPDRTLPSSLGGNKWEADVFYGALYDSEGEDGDFYTTADSQGTSTDVGSPGDYTATHVFSANPGAGGGTPVSSGDACNSLGPPSSQAGSWADWKFTIPAGAKKAVFKLFPHGDWDLRVLSPDDEVADAGYFVGFEESITVPGNAIPSLTPGAEYTVRACNTTGEPSILGAVIIT